MAFLSPAIVWSLCMDCVGNVGGGFLVEAIAFFCLHFLYASGFFNWIFDARFFECCFFLKHCFGVLLGWFFAYSTFFVGEFDPGSG